MDQQTEIKSSSNDIALCLSGGGYRAAAYHLGALEMLHELKMEDRIKYISTASGGTIVAMKYVLDMAEGKEFKEFETEFKAFLLKHNVVNDAFAALTEKRFADQKNDVSLIRAAAGVYNEHLTSRLDVQHLINKTIDTGKYKDLIFNVTEFYTGGGFRFRLTSKKRLKFGSGTFDVKDELRGGILLGDIVAASSCFPGAFEPMRFPDDFNFPKSEIERYPFKGKRSAVQSIPMMDGGVFDNQGLTGLMTSYKKTAPFDFVLISDTTQKADTILHYEIKERVPGLSLGSAFWAFFTMLLFVFLSSLVLIGLAISNIAVVPTVQFVLTEIAAILSLIVTGLLLLLLAYARYSLGSLRILGAELPMWSFIESLNLHDIISLVSSRLESVKGLLLNVFMKRIRDLNYKTELTAVDDKRKNLLHGKNVFSLIYDLEERSEKPMSKDESIRSTPRMIRISKAAGKVPTMLWLTQHQIEVLVECGRISTCLALLRLSWSKWQKATAEAEEAIKNGLRVKLPLKPTDPASSLFSEYERTKDKWIELVEAKLPDAIEV